MNKYLSLLQTHGIEPNFECSEEFFHSAGWKEVQINTIEDTTCVVNKDGSQILPSITNGGVILNDSCYIGFPGMDRGPMLDYEFIYNLLPMDFKFEGKEWKTTRKNMRKAEKELGKLRFEIVPNNVMDNSVYKLTQEMIEKMLMDWGADREMFAADSFVHYALRGRNRIFVRTPNGVLVAVLAWDFNYKYVNFRLCLAAPVQGLSDWCRIRFRQLVGMKWPGMQINDGGVCKNKGLYQYKERLCPIKINKICSVSSVS